MIKRFQDLFTPDMLGFFREFVQEPPFAKLQVGTEEWTTDLNCSPKLLDRVKYICCNSHDLIGLVADVELVRQGLRVVNVNENQYQALCNIELRMGVEDFSSPYPAFVVGFPPGRYVKASTIYRYSQNIMIIVAHDWDMIGGVVTAIRQQDGKTMEEFITKFDPDCKDTAQGVANAYRVACNMALALTNFGYQSQVIFPKEQESDRKLAREQSPRGDKARQRLRETPVEISFNQEVQLYHHEGSHKPGEPTGREMPFHWRRGHWAYVPCGVGRTERRLVLRKPCMVRADLLTIDPSETVTVYK